MIQLKAFERRLVSFALRVRRVVTLDRLVHLRLRFTRLHHAGVGSVVLDPFLEICKHLLERLEPLLAKALVLDDCLIVLEYQLNLRQSLN